VSVADAIAHLDAAIAALSYDEAVSIDRFGRESDVPPIERCIASDLRQLERYLQPRDARPTLIGAIAESLSQAFIEIHAARQALDRPARRDTIGDSDGSDGA
jgi:hypothetical protein